MNVLIVADKVNGRAYADIINQVHNTKVIGIVNKISDSFITDLGTRYTPNVVIFDTAVDYNNSLPKITQTISDTYSYIKIIILAEADESRFFPSASVVKGAISSKDIDEMLTKINKNYDSNGSEPTEELCNRVSQPAHRADIKVKTVKQKKQKVKKYKAKRKTFKFNPLFLLPVVVLTIVVVVAVCIKFYNNKSADVEPTASIDTTETASPDEVPSSQAATIKPPATIPTIFENGSVTATVAVSSPNNDSDTSSTESETEKEFESDSENDSDNNVPPPDNYIQQNNDVRENDDVPKYDEENGSIAYSYSYVTVSVPEYDYGSNTEKKEVPVSRVTLNCQSKTLTIGENLNLYATVFPSDADVKTVHWITSNAAVATVNDGLVVPHSVGITYITASSGGCSATCTITVK